MRAHRCGVGHRVWRAGGAPDVVLVAERLHHLGQRRIDVRAAVQDRASVLSDVDPNITLLNVQTLQEQVDSNLDQQRAIAQLTGLFGLLALILAAVGLYGVTAYAVERRTSEIGVRMALGANRSNVISLVLHDAFLQILIGLAIGIPISIGCSRLIANQLYQVKGWDPLVLSVSILALGLCALAASIIPAQRAASINPVTALRVE